MIPGCAGFRLRILAGATLMLLRPNLTGSEAYATKPSWTAARRVDSMNYFAYPTAAQRYAEGRPFFHPLAAKKIRAICCEHGRIDRALDVGCGTGQSTVALLDVADEIIGLDNSAEMLSYAPRLERIQYVRAQAEGMPFLEESFGLITVALAFHWLDPRKFLLDAHRVMKTGGWLVIYNDAFTGRMVGNGDFAAWNRESYLARYPSPPRESRLLAEFDASEYGFTSHTYDQFVHEVEFTPDQLVRYLLTQTNVIAAVEAGNEHLHSVAQWLLSSVRPMFDTGSKSFSFSCEIRFLKRA
jgi:ubiquinone/menaquinone biosynthesis C-methylase UbiE